MKLNDLVNSMLQKTSDVFHYKAAEPKGNYFVWQEESENTIHCDNKPRITGIKGSIDYFTKTEFDPVKAEIEELWNEGGLSYKLNSIQYEESTGFIHYEWLFEVENG